MNRVSHIPNESKISLPERQIRWFQQQSALFKNLTIQTQDIPKELIAEIKDIQKQIPEADLYTKEDVKGWIEGGLSILHHITIILGVEPKEKEAIELIVKTTLADDCMTNVDKIDYFDNKEDGYTVAVLRVNPDRGLSLLHDLLKEEVTNKDTYPEFKPHITIAYLQYGKRLPVDKVGDHEWHIENVEMSKKDGGVEKVSSLVVAKCPVERTLPILRDLKQKGYDTVTFEAQGNSCSICNDLDGTEWDLTTFINQTTHLAPVYTVAHPGCRDNIRVTGPDLKDVVLNYRGII